jgi:transposase
VEILVQDESIFVYDSLVRKKWTAKRVRPTVIITGSHQKTCVFGTLSLDGRQLFRQYNRFNEDTFLSYLKKVKRKIKRHLSDNSNNIKFEYFPKGSPEFSVVEECRKQGKDDLLVSEYYPKFRRLKERIPQYYRTKDFKLDTIKYLLRDSADLC